MPIIQHLGTAISSGGASGTDINLLLRGKWGSSGSDSATGATVSDYLSLAQLDNYSGQKSNTFGAANFTRVGDGILSFILPAATYKIYAKSGSGSGSTGSWSGMSTEANFTLGSDVNVLLLIPNHGKGSYGAGGGLFLIIGTDYTSSSNTPVLILGGGGGGYSYTNTFGAPGNLSTSLSQSRRGPSRGTSGDYDGGAGWISSYTPESYSNSYSSYRAKHFVEGGKGGTVDACNLGGGFGGGGGGCPAGAGGLQGGYPGDNSHSGGGYGGSGSGGQMGGGGGTSYYNSSYITNLSNTSYGSANTTNYGSDTTASNGYFGIYTV